MSKYNFSEIVLISFPFTNIKENKKRPALVLTDTGDEDVIVCRISSGKVKSSFDVNIINWKSTGLLMPSVCRVNKITTLEKKLIDKKLGKLNENDLKAIKVKFNNLFSFKI